MPLLALQGLPTLDTMFKMSKRFYHKVPCGCRCHKDSRDMGTTELSMPGNQFSPQVQPLPCNSRRFIIPVKREWIRNRVLFHQSTLPRSLPPSPAFPMVYKEKHLHASYAESFALRRPQHLINHYILLMPQSSLAPWLLLWPSLSPG